MTEKRARITRVTAEKARRTAGGTDYARVDALTDADIAKGVAEDPDAVPIDSDWTNARVVFPAGGEDITLRIDRDVLDWFRRQGKRYHHRINAALRADKEAHQGRDC